MSASAANSAIYLTDTPEDIRVKIRTHAFSGGRKTMKEHRERGADLDVRGSAWQCVAVRGSAWQCRAARNCALSVRAVV
jgi:tryptophanyl-tRNA synthetase